MGNKSKQRKVAGKWAMVRNVAGARQPSARMPMQRARRNSPSAARREAGILQERARSRVISTGEVPYRRRKSAAAEG